VSDKRLVLTKDVRRSLSWVLLTGAFLVSLRRVSLGWGASGEEIDQVLPGDGLLSDADLCATRAITIGATVAEVWPWIAQLGQGRGGFYSYDLAENLIGCDIHSADAIVQEWQSIAVGDQIKLAPDVGLTVVQMEPERSLVLRGGIPAAVRRNSPYDFTWAFVLFPGPDETTRLVVRERYTYSHRWVAVVVEPVELVSFVMSRRMMRGIRQRAERTSGGMAPAPVT
jgi:hypothetical protein